MKLEPIQTATLPNSGTLRRIKTHDQFIYTLTDKGLTGEIRKFNRDLAPIWGRTTPYSVNDMCISDEGIIITGHHYVKGLSGLSISSPMIAKMNLEGTVEWQRGPRPPDNFVDDWNEEPPISPPTASAKMWKATTLPGGGAIAMGLRDVKDGNILYHHRFDRHGRTIWTKGCAIINTDWMYTYPGKVEPMFARHKEHIYHFGAYRLKQSTSQLAGFKLHIRSGQITKRYESDRDYQIFTSGALSKKGDCAIGATRPQDAPSTILALDSNFDLKSELTTSLQPWNDIMWNENDEAIIVGSIKQSGTTKRSPGIERFLIRENPVSRPQLFNRNNLSGFARLSAFHHAFISIDEDQKSQLTIRRLEDGYSCNMKSDSMTNLQLESTEDGGAVVGLNNRGSDMTLISF